MRKRTVLSTVILTAFLALFLGCENTDEPTDPYDYLCLSDQVINPVPGISGLYEVRTNANVSAQFKNGCYDPQFIFDFQWVDSTGRKHTEEKVAPAYEKDSILISSGSIQMGKPIHFLSPPSAENPTGRSVLYTVVQCNGPATEENTSFCVKVLLKAH